MIDVFGGLHVITIKIKCASWAKRKLGIEGGMAMWNLRGKMYD